MAASDNLNPDQLRMFMRPQEVMDYVTDSLDAEDYNDGNFASIDDVWRGKEQEVEQDPYFQDLKKAIKVEGVHKPIELAHDIYRPSSDHRSVFMSDGHHRVVIAKQLEEETGKHYYLPVTHYSHW